ncbi:MAG: BMP family ABC transporter substrate-binding protein, partial [Pseudomonadota bacterium]
QMDRGADVVYSAAGATGLGVIRAVADEGELAIGVDSDQYSVAPGSVLTSMLKRVDNAAYNTFMDAMNGDFTPGVQVLGIAEGGIDYVANDENADVLTPEIRAAIEAAKANILSGELTVHNYESDGDCPV